MKITKTTLLLSTACWAIGIAQLKANDIFSLDDFPSATYTKHYNALPSVENSDRKLQSHPSFSLFLKDAEEMVVGYDLDSYIGFRLIHNHFLVEDGKVMAESYEKFNDVPSLVTSAKSLEEAQERRAVPASWILNPSNKKDIEIFEASSDEAVREGIKLVSKEPEFMEETATLLEKHNLGELLSLALLKRGSLEPNREDQQYVEVNDLSPRQSVVQLWSTDKVPLNSIRTSWSFKGPRAVRCWPSSVCVYQVGSGHWHSTKHQHSN